MAAMRRRVAGADAQFEEEKTSDVLTSRLTSPELKLPLITG
jgi:hypothetical protein